MSPRRRRTRRQTGGRNSRSVRCRRSRWKSRRREEEEGKKYTWLTNTVHGKSLVLSAIREM